jgi:hypothetical protein
LGNSQLKQHNHLVVMQAFPPFLQRVMLAFAPLIVFYLLYPGIQAIF